MGTISDYINTNIIVIMFSTVMVHLEITKTDLGNYFFYINTNITVFMYSLYMYIIKPAWYWAFTYKTQVYWLMRNHG